MVFYLHWLGLLQLSALVGAAAACAAGGLKQLCTACLCHAFQLSAGMRGLRASSMSYTQRNRVGNLFYHMHQHLFCLDPPSWLQ